MLTVYSSTAYKRQVFVYISFSYYIHKAILQAVLQSAPGLLHFGRAEPVDSGWSKNIHANAASREAKKNLQNRLGMD